MLINIINKNAATQYNIVIKGTKILYRIIVAHGRSVAINKYIYFPLIIEGIIA